MAILAPSLYRGRATIDKHWPNRDRSSDGWIGDAAHAARNSDHNPNARGIVDAIDVDMFGGPTPVIRGAIVAGAILHPAVHYVIFNRRIFQAEDRFQPRVYDGINPHDHHCHVSIWQMVSAEQSTVPWSMWEAFPMWNPFGPGVSGWYVRELQALLNAWGASLVVDGDYGPLTTAAVRNIQRRSGFLPITGAVTTATRDYLFT